jgi:hypothetical protein
MPSLLMALVLAAAGPAAHAAETSDAVTVDVQIVSLKLGAPGTIVAKVTPKNGYQIADAYRNRVYKLTAADDGLQLDSKPVRGVMQDGSLVFRIPVTATKPGPHAINGVMRFAFVSAADQERRLDIKWEPLMATVNATE